MCCPYANVLQNEYFLFDGYISLNHLCTQESCMKKKKRNMPENQKAIKKKKPVLKSKSVAHTSKKNIQISNSKQAYFNIWPEEL